MNQAINETVAMLLPVVHRFGGTILSIGPKESSTWTPDFAKLCYTDLNPQECEFNRADRAGMFAALHKLLHEAVRSDTHETAVNFYPTQNLIEIVRGKPRRQA